MPTPSIELCSGAHGVWSAKKRMYTLHFYKDRQQQWRWRLTAGNGRKVANGGEGYRHRRDALAITRKLFPWFFNKA